MRHLLLYSLAFISFSSYSQQQSLSLDSCQKEVNRNYPLSKGKEFIKTTSELNIENLGVNYLPKLFANGKVSYQSDVVGITIPGMNTPKAPNQQIAFNIDVEQLIFDGGRTKVSKELESNNGDVELQNLNVRLFQLQKNVNDAYFGIMLMRKSQQLLENKKLTVEKRLEQLRIFVKNGVTLKANQQILESEILIIEQQQLELANKEESFRVILSQLMGRQINAETTFDELNVPDNFDNSLGVRPESELFTSQKSVFDTHKKLLQKNRMPILAAFGQVGYGNPGYNMLNDGFDSYYMVGAKLSWNIFDWKSTRRKKRMFDIRKDLIDTEEQSFKRRQTIELESEINKIKMYNLQLSKDEAVVALLEQVSLSAASQFDNGTTTSSAYIEDLNREIQAKINREFHNIQLQQAWVEYKRVKGN